jgi:hypothetical protein
MASQDFTSAGISLGGIAIDAFEPSVTRTAIIAKPWIFAMMRLSDRTSSRLVREKPQPPCNLDPLRSFGISAAT